MKAVQLIANELLPEELRDYRRSYDAGSVGVLMAEVAKTHPGRYAEISKGISDIGRHAAYRQGETLTLSDMRGVLDRDAVLDKMDTDVAAARQEHRNDKDFETARMGIWQHYAHFLDKATQKAAMAAGNNLAYSVVSGARGKSAQLKMMVTTPGLYTDYRDATIPMFIRNSFGEGLRPAEYLASTYGARKSVLSTKRATAKGGDLAKQMVQSSSPIIVTARDCGTANGIDLAIDDDSLRGRVLAAPAAGLVAGSVLDKDALRELRSAKIGKVIVRSAMTCQAPEGVCAHCVGADGRGHFPKKGNAVGITSAQAIGEPITQSALNCLVEGTRVRMADLSVREIQTIKLGEKVMGSDIEGNTFPVTVLSLWDQGLQPVQRYTYRMGSTRQDLRLECTTKHEVLSNKKVSGAHLKKKYNGEFGFGGPENYQAIKLRAGYPHKNLAAVLPISNTDERVAIAPHALLCGVILGDGIRWDDVLHPDSCPRMSCADPLLVADLNRHMAAAGVVLKKSKRSHDYRFAHSTSQGFSNRDATTGQMVQTPTRHFMKSKLIEWGFAGKYAHEKQVPFAARSWRKEDIGALVAGYLATDGSVGVNDSGQMFISFGSTSKKMLEGLKELIALRLCVYSSALTKTGSAGNGNRVHDMWAFTITRQDQVRKLLENIPTIPGCKGPATEALLESVDYELRHKEPFYRAKRRSVEELGQRHCWDISVDHPDQLFVLENGLIVSNTKHVAGVAGQKREYSGFAVLNQLVQSPEIFPDRAAVAEQEGTVSAITEASQGGHFVKIGDRDHYVPQGYPVLAKIGQKVEAGDQLSDGIVDPGDILRLRGLGEGRRFYADRLKQALDDSGLKADRRNTEILSRGAINHVVINHAEGLDGYLPDDTADYNTFSTRYVPPPETARTAALNSVGKYLQAPALHYSIGTKLTRRMADHLHGAGLQEVMTTDTEPPFTPDMVRLRTAAHGKGDWLASQHSSFLKGQLGDAAVRGEDTNVGSNVHFAPRLARGVGFADNIEETGKF